MLFLSQVIGKPVLDRDGGAFGKVRDLIVALGEQYPPVTGVVIRVTGGRDIFLPWSDVEDFYVYKPPYDREEHWQPEYWICTKEAALAQGVRQEIFLQPTF